MRIYRQVKRGVSVQRRPPARRPGRFTVCSALLSFSRSHLSTGPAIAYLVFGGSVLDDDELVPGEVDELDDGLGDEGVVLDDDEFGDGVTTGGVFGDVDVLLSR